MLDENESGLCLATSAAKGGVVVAEASWNNVCSGSGLLPTGRMAVVEEERGCGDWHLVLPACWPKMTWTDVRKPDVGQRVVVLLRLVGCRCFVMGFDTMRSRTWYVSASKTFGGWVQTGLQPCSSCQPVVIVSFGGACFGADGVDMSRCQLVSRQKRERTFGFPGWEDNVVSRHPRSVL